jgi:serine/threonine-protein kinase ATR
MARKGGGSTQRMAPPPITNGLATASGNPNVPPPSTIAAQIVQNASNLHSRHDAAAKVSFGELVKEFLQHPSTDEPDPQLVALICVIAEAGLEGLFKDDPFAQDQQRQQGVDSVSALDLIIRKKPHLLLSAKDASEEGTPQPPLFLWLFPKLLGLMSHATLQPLHHHAQDLLTSCLEVLSQNPSFWRSAASVAALYRSSVQRKCSHRPNPHPTTKQTTVIIVKLQAVSDLNLPLSRSLRVELPSSGSIGEFWPQSQHFVALPHELQKTVSTHTGAIYIAYSLLLSLVRSAHGSRAQCTETAAFEHQQPWILDACHVLWRHFKRWTNGPDKRSYHDEVAGSYVQVLEAITVSMKISENQPSGSAKAAQSLVLGLSNLLENSSLSAVNQVQLASLLIHLRAVLGDFSQTTSADARQRVLPSLVIVEGLVTTISQFCHDVDKFSSVQRDLKVFLNKNLYQRNLLTAISQHFVYGRLQALGLLK